MSGPVFKVTVFSMILLLIILSSIIFGGFSSLYRSQNRIESAKVLLMEACRERSGFLPDIIKLSESVQHQVRPSGSEAIDSGLTGWNEDMEKSESLINKILSQQNPMGEAQTRAFENLQNNIGLTAKKIFAQLNSTYELNTRQDSKQSFELLKKDFLKAQDKVSAAKKRYNYEVDYFNRRVHTFPLFLIARLFNFDGIVYYPFVD